MASAVIAAVCIVTEAGSAVTGSGSAVTGSGGAVTAVYIAYDEVTEAASSFKTLGKPQKLDGVGPVDNRPSTD